APRCGPRGTRSPSPASCRRTGASARRECAHRTRRCRSENTWPSSRSVASKSGRSSERPPGSHPRQEYAVAAWDPGGLSLQRPEPFGPLSRSCMAMTDLDFRALWDQALSYDEFVKQSTEHCALWTGVYRLAQIPAWALERACERRGTLRLLVVAEDWCGDASNT